MRELGKSWAWLRLSLKAVVWCLILLFFVMTAGVQQRSWAVGGVIERPILALANRAPLQTAQIQGWKRTQDPAYTQGVTVEAQELMRNLIARTFS